MEDHTDGQAELLRGKSWARSRKFGIVMALADEARTRREVRCIVMVLGDDRLMGGLC
jgi:hypothetical protein